METLTVYETVCTSSAPSAEDMSLEAKKFRTLETKQELGILGIKDSRIGGLAFTAGGSKEGRGISGGESVESRSLANWSQAQASSSVMKPLLAWTPTMLSMWFSRLSPWQRRTSETVIFSIHQPRSNIVALFDKLLLLAEGRVVFSGPFSRCGDTSIRSASLPAWLQHC